MRRVLDWTARAAVFALALVASEAAAQPGAEQRVVVESFGGPRGGTTRAALIRNLEANGIFVVPNREVTAARGELGIGRRMSRADYVELGRVLDVSAFIEGRVSRQRRRWSLRVTVRNAADGEQVGRESWGGRTAASLGAVRRNGYDRLEPYLAETSSPAAPPPVPENVSPWHAEQAAEPPEPVEEPPSSTDGSQRYDSFRFALRGGTLYRWTDTTVQVYAAQRGQVSRDAPNASTELLEEERAFRGPGIGHAELGAQLEFYPGALGDQPFPYLGALVSFSHSLAPEARAPHRDNPAQTVSVPTNQLELLLAARGRYRFGDDRREPEVRIDVGWGMYNFDLGLTELQEISPSYVLPPMQHGYVHLGAGLSYGIVPTYLTASLEFAYRIGTHIGADTRNVWGTETAPSNGLSLSLELKSEIPEIAPGAFIALSVSYFQFTTAFSGQTGCAQPDDICDIPMEPWEDERLWEVWPAAAGNVSGGPIDDVNDNYVRLQLSIGYAFQ